MHTCVRTPKFKRSSLQQSYFRQKEEKDEFGNEVNNGDLNHLLPKNKSHVHVEWPEKLILLRSVHNKQEKKLPQTSLALLKIFKDFS